MKKHMTILHEFIETINEGNPSPHVFASKYSLEDLTAMLKKATDDYTSMIKTPYNGPGVGHDQLMQDFKRSKEMQNDIQFLLTCCEIARQRQHEPKRDQRSSAIKWSETK